MNTAPTTGFVATRPAFEHFSDDLQNRWSEWHVIDRRNGQVIAKCCPPQQDNLADAVRWLQEDCEHCYAGLETVDAPSCPYCEGTGLSGSGTCGECCGDGNLEASEPCQRCGRLGPDSWISPLGLAECIAGELNALCFSSTPSTADLIGAAKWLRIEGATA